MILDRRAVSAGLAASLLGAALPITPGRAAPAYAGPKVIIVRFGGGVRRRETIAEQTTLAPFLAHELIPRGALIPDLRIAALEGVDTSHAEGTLNLLTGRYLAYRKVGQNGLKPTAPTLFEYFRKAFDAPAHQALLINGEDRLQEEFLGFGAHHGYGVDWRAETLSLHRLRLHGLRNTLRLGRGSDEELAQAEKRLAALTARDPRGAPIEPSAEIAAFWDRWRAYYGAENNVRPRGDRLLTELALRALVELRPKLMMINYQDPDYVHWGVASHYDRAIGVIDDGLRRLAAAVESDPDYRDDTVFVVTPDCGRDANPLMDVPFQHHFNSRSAHEVWALVMGPGVARGAVLDRPRDQSAVAATVAALMGFRAIEAESGPIEEVFT